MKCIHLRKNHPMSDEPEPPKSLFKKSTKPKKPSRVRLSLTEDEPDANDDLPVVFKAKKPPPVHRAISTLKGKTLAKTGESSSNYSSEYLESLRESTPVTPKDYITDFGAVASEEVPYTQDDDAVSVKIDIPSAGIIKHRKEQRELRRLAGEDYISLSDSQSLTNADRNDFGPRLQTEDDIDHFGGDGTEGMKGYESDTLPLGMRNIKLAAERKRQDIADAIGDVEEERLPEQSESDDSSDSDDEWERVQIHKAGGPSSSKPKEPKASQVVSPVIVPILTVDQVLAKLGAELNKAKEGLAQKRQLIEQIEAEQVEIAEREDAINKGLQRASLVYESTIQAAGGLQELRS